MVGVVLRFCRVLSEKAPAPPVKRFSDAVVTDFPQYRYNLLSTVW